MKSNITCFIALVLLVALQACAGKELDNKVSNEKVDNSHELATSSKQTIENARNLDSEQKINLLALRKETHAKLDKIQVENLRLQSLLVKDMVATDYDNHEVGQIKDKLKKMEDQRLSVIFDAINKANAILGHKAAGNEFFISDFFNENRTFEGRDKTLE